jgi:hypothetical protein
VEILQSKIDPFEWKLLDQQLAQNARNAVKRCAMLFGQLQVDPQISMKNNEKNMEDQPLIDIMPRLEGVSRLCTIPRLTKIKVKI